MPYKAERFLACPNCEATVTGQDESCRQCGKKFAKDTKFKCPSCGKLIARRWRRCPTCDADLTMEPKLVSAGPVEVERAEDRKAESEYPEARGTTREPSPTAAVDAAVKVEPEPSTARGPPEPRAEDVVPEPTRSIASRKTTRRLADSQSCPTCGSAVPRDSTTCPVCQADMPRQPARPATEMPKPLVARLETSEEAPRPAKTRRLKSEKIATIPPMRTSTRDLTNGVGQTSGMGKVNGTGLRGGSFVNGTGLSTAPGPGGHSSRSGPTTPWKLLVVLMALAIVIPTFVILSYSKTRERFTIDGDFADWADVPRYGVESHSSVPPTNIVEWSVDFQGPDVYLYLRTQAAMMSAQNPESMYLFVDSDGINSTGYVVESLGADYLLQMTGWGSGVNQSGLLRYPAGPERYDWNAWMQIGTPTSVVRQDKLEAHAELPAPLSDAARFVLVSKDASDAGSVSYVAPAKGGLLVIEQSPSTEAATGVVMKSTSVAMVAVTLRCEGASGTVRQLSSSVSGAAPLAIQGLPVSLSPGEAKVLFVSVDTSASAISQCISSGVLPSSVDSTFSEVEIVGPAVKAYADSPPSGIVIDGAFADWEGRVSADHDAVPITDHDVDIDLVGRANSSQDSFFFVSVKGRMCNGTFVPALVARPTAGGGGGAVVLTKRSAEDTLTVYVDSDRSSSTGQQVSLDSKHIGADQKIVVKGLFGVIMSKDIYSYLAGSWSKSPATVQAAKDEQRIEIGVAVSAIGGNSDIEFIIETTSWKGRADLAAFDSNNLTSLTRAWVVDPLTASPYATSMSYQRKMMYDGVNFWSLYFDGTNTVLKYSIDDGKTWIGAGKVFSTSGVNETSIWYDSSTNTVYAVGDTSVASRAIFIQTGMVSPATHAIAWAPRDSLLNTSSVAMPGKNTYICKDTNGYLWVISSNCTQDKPGRYWLNAFKSRDVNRTDNWVETGQLLPWYLTTDNAKGTIVPAGTGSDVWAVYIYGGYVSARKYTGTWGADQRIYTLFGSVANTDNSPPSVVVDKQGVVHVVYGTGLRVGGGGGVSTPEIMYSHNDTGLMSFTAGLNLDPNVPKGIGGFYPTISLDSSTGDLYVLWLQNILNDPSYAPKTVLGRQCSSGTWSNMTIQTQTNSTKMFLTSVYSVPNGPNISWEWTQNRSLPIEVLYDRVGIPEFGDLAFPSIGLLAIFVAYSAIPRRRDDEFG